MGVKGLWQLLEPTGKAINPEYLSGKALAVDISVWLHQFSKGMRDSDGNPLLNNHLIGMFKRICKLLYFGIKPVFVFDGAVPMLKKQVILQRQKRRSQYSRDSKQAAKKLVSALLRKHAIKNLSVEADPEIPSSRKKQQEDDLFVLPSIDYPLRGGADDDSNRRNDIHSSQEDSYQLSNYGISQNIDLNSKDFDDLPATLKLEILIDHKEREKNKNTDWDDLREIPKNSDDFSSYQLQRLLKSNDITQKIDALRREVNKAAEVDDPDTFGARIFSSADTRYVLKRKRQTHLGKWEDKFLKKFCSEASHNSMQYTPGAFDIGKSSIDFENFYGIDEMDDRFKVVPEVVKEMDLKTRSLNFQPWSEGKNEERKETKDVVTSEAGMESESGDDDDDDDFIEVEPLVGQESFDNNNETNMMLNIENVNHPTTQRVTNSLSTDWTIANMSIMDSTNDRTASSESEVRDPSHALKTTNPHKSGACSLNINDTKSDCVDDTRIIGKDVISTESGAHSNYSTSFNVPHVTEEITKDIGVDIGIEISEALQPTNLKACDDSLSRSAVEQIETVIPLTNGNLCATEPISEDVADDDDDDDDDDYEEEVKELLAEVFEACKDNEKASLESVEQKLATRVEQLRSEVGKNDRLAATTITDQVHHEVQDLLQLFGVPYLVSPGEAEAQCAHLDGTGQTEGTITDDSDVFLFGGRRVVRHLFDRDEVTEMYDMRDVEKKLLLNQSNLICMAMLCGCDYTEGIRNVGPVTATEIVQEFKGHDMDCLIKFRDWLVKAKRQKNPPDNETKIKSQLRRLHLFDGFPNPSVFNAYKHPTVDASMESFTWRKPELEQLRQFALKTLNWTIKQTDDMIGPLVTKLEKSSNQKHVTDYFGSASVPSSLGKKLKSKRVRRVVNVRKTERRKGLDEEVNKVIPKTIKDLKKSLSSSNKSNNKSSNNTKKMKEIDLSEESGDDDDDDVSDDVLASMNIDDIVEKAKCSKL